MLVASRYLRFNGRQVSWSGAWRAEAAAPAGASGDVPATQDAQERGLFDHLAAWKLRAPASLVPVDGPIASRKEALDARDRCAHVLSSSSKQFATRHRRRRPRSYP